MADRSAISLEEFKARLPIAEVVGRHVRLSRRGHDLWGCCPFHSEKTPSFHVVPDKGFYHCFGCGQHGNAIDFVMAIEGLEFGPALQRLAELCGLPAPRSGGESKPAVDRTIYAANQAAARWFAGCLEAQVGARAAAYLSGRGLNRAIIERFGIGYAPDDRSALKRAMLAEGYTERQLLEAGLIVAPEDGGASYDRFRDRIMFPIQDHRGRVVGFGGRTLGAARAKYLNTPETAAFRKGELLYGLPLARGAIREHGRVIVAEGYMDVIALARAGFAHAVAALGTAISEAQLAQLWQLADEPIICLDSDEAGVRAGQRLIERALPLLRPGKSIRFALMPRGLDPDSAIRKRGVEAVGKYLNETYRLVDFLWMGEVANRDLEQPEQRAALRKRFVQLGDLIVDRELRRAFVQAVDKRMEARFGRGHYRRKVDSTQISRQAAISVGAARLAAGIAMREGFVEGELVWAVIMHPEILELIEEELAAVELIDQRLDALRDAILSWYGERGHLDLGDLKDHLSEIGFASEIEHLHERLPLWCAAHRDPASVLEGWRACLAERRRFAEIREHARAAEAAIAANREREAADQMLAVDRLINAPGARRMRAKSAED